jgi:hypothetical protein
VLVVLVIFAGVVGQTVILLMTQISFRSDLELVGLTVTVLRALPFFVGVIDASLGVLTLVLSAGVFAQTFKSWPIKRWSQSQPLLASLSSSKVQPSFSAIFTPESPSHTVYLPGFPVEVGLAGLPVMDVLVYSGWEVLFM